MLFTFPVYGLLYVACFTYSLIGAITTLARVIDLPVPRSCILQATVTYTFRHGDIHSLRINNKINHYLQLSLSVDIHDVITCATFCDGRLRGLGVARGRISHFPIDLRRRLYNTLALPCECVMSIRHLKVSTYFTPVLVQ